MQVLSSQSGVAEDPVLLAYEAPTLDNRFPTCLRNAVPSSSRVYGDSDFNVFFKTSGTDYPIIQPHVPLDWNHKTGCSENLKMQVTFSFQHSSYILNLLKPTGYVMHQQV